MHNKIAYHSTSLGRDLFYLYIWTPKESKTVEITKELYLLQALRDYAKFSFIPYVVRKYVCGEG